MYSLTSGPRVPGAFLQLGLFCLSKLRCAFSPRVWQRHSRNHRSGSCSALPLPSLRKEHPGDHSLQASGGHTLLPHLLVSQPCSLQESARPGPALMPGCLAKQSRGEGILPHGHAYNQPLSEDAVAASTLPGQTLRASWRRRNSAFTCQLHPECPAGCPAPQMPHLPAP